MPLSWTLLLFWGHPVHATFPLAPRQDTALGCLFVCLFVFWLFAYVPTCDGCTKAEIGTMGQENAAVSFNDNG